MSHGASRPLLGLVGGGSGLGGLVSLAQYLRLAQAAPTKQAPKQPDMSENYTHMSRLASVFETRLRPSPTSNHRSKPQPARPQAGPPSSPAAEYLRLATPVRQTSVSQPDMFKTRLTCRDQLQAQPSVLPQAQPAWSGWVFGGLLVGLGCEASLRHIRQAWPAAGHACRDQQTLVLCRNGAWT